MHKGQLREGETILWVDAHQLLNLNSNHLSRVKKIVGLTLMLGLANRIKLNIWGQEGDFDQLDMVP